MNEQLSLFDYYEESDFYSNVQCIINEITKAHNLPTNSIHLYSNLSIKGKDKGKEKSKSLCIYEPAYPVGAYGSDTPGRNYTILNFNSTLPEIVLKIRNVQFDSIDLPCSASSKVLKSSPGFHFVTFGTDDNSVYGYIKDNIVYCLANYKSSSSFGCCDRFVQCSDAKECVHDNKIYAMGCKYRANLEMGRIFYGKNKNI